MELAGVDPEDRIGKLLAASNSSLQLPMETRRRRPRSVAQVVGL